MNWQYIWNIIPRFVDATFITLQLSFWAIVLSLLVGFFSAVVTTYKIRMLNPVVKFYIELSRNTPLLIQVFFLYFGLSKVGIKLDGFTCAIIGLAFLGGSYMAEAVRGGLEAISLGIRFKFRIDAGTGLSLRIIPSSLCYRHAGHWGQLLIFNERNLRGECDCHCRVDVYGKRNYRHGLQNE